MLYIIHVTTDFNNMKYIQHFDKISQKNISNIYLYLRLFLNIVKKI